VKLENNVLENLREALIVSADLFSRPGMKRVVLRKVQAAASILTPGISIVLRKADSRLDLEIGDPSHGEGGRVPMFAA